MNEVWIAMGLTLLAGMATGIGSIIAFAAKRTNFRFLSVATGFSAGVMLYISFVEIFYKGVASLTEQYGSYWGHWINAASFFGGMFVIGVIDQLIPTAENPHETRAEEETMLLRNPSAPCPDLHAACVETAAGSAGALNNGESGSRNLMRMGLFTAVAIGIHNFPEGLATFLAALQDPSLGVAVAVAIALHNIPEGISVSVPIFYATGDRTKAFTYSLVSGIAEPVGAGTAYVAIRFFVGGESGAITPQVMGILFGGVAGIMVYISLDQLLPTSRAYGKGHDSLFGLVGGMLIIALSLLVMK
jgi:ZIP family zinc transporter